MTREQVGMTRALVRSGGGLPAVAAAQGEVWDAHEPRLLLGGPDTVYFSFADEVSDEMWAHLDYEQLRAKADDEERKAAYAPEWLGGVMATTGARGGYRVELESTKAYELIPARVRVRPRCRVTRLNSGGYVSRSPILYSSRCIDSCNSPN